MLITFFLKIAELLYSVSEMGAEFLVPLEKHPELKHGSKCLQKSLISAYKSANVVAHC